MTRRVRIRRRLFESRVARRVFAVFALCSLLPVTVFSLLSQRSVSNQLRAQSDSYLHRAVKASGLVLLERLRAAEEDLGQLPLGAFEGLHAPDPRFESALEQRFWGVALVREHSPDGHPAAWWGEPFELPQLTPSERQRLAGRRGLVRVAGPAESPRVLLYVPSLAESGHLVANVRTSYLFTEGQSLSEGRFVVCQTASGDLIYENGPSVMRSSLQEQLAEGETSASFAWSHGGEEYLARSWLIFLKHDYDAEWILAESESATAAVLASGRFRQTFVLVAVLTFLCVTVLSLGQIRRYLVPLERLKAGTQRIAEGVFDRPVVVQSEDEFQDLAESFNGMARQLEELLSVRRALIDVGIALTAQRDTLQLLHTLLARARDVLDCDAAGILVVGLSGRPEQCLADLAGRSVTLDAAAVAGERWSDAQVPRISGDARRLDTMAPPSATAAIVSRLAEAAGCASHSALWVPLFDQDDQLIGLLVLFHAQDRQGQRRRDFRDIDLELASLLGAQASAALTKNRLTQSFKDLFDGMINLIAAAIDEKSPHTGQHCARVPVLTEMLARAACEETEGPLAEFRLSDEEWYELHVAAMLHDCGKVATPVHVMDKSRKLETLFDRIELVRARFEILRRDLRIGELEASWRSTGGSSDAAERTPPMLEAMARDLESLERWNVGGEFMPPEAQEEVRKMARRYAWTDAAGVDHPLLTDEEVENLVVSRGTLTAAERKVIENHVVSTIRMLERLPYPRNLRQVPLIAGAHHERMDGRGYPDGRCIGELPVQARILGVADVFEALTAKDRPYKDARSLSQTLFIMAKMREEGHIDPDLFEVFLVHGVYLEYAAQYLEPSQIDEVDVVALPGCAHLAARLPRAA